MTDLYDEVMHHLEGVETEEQTWITANGPQTIQASTWGPDRWIDRAMSGRLKAIDLLALLLFAIQDFRNTTDGRKVIEAWAPELRRAAESGEVVARDFDTLLPMTPAPDGWLWHISESDADKFIAARGLSWTWRHVIEHIHSECRGASASSQPTHSDSTAASAENDINHPGTTTLESAPFSELSDELRKRLVELIEQRRKKGRTKKKGPDWTDAQRVTAAEVVQALENLRTGAGVKTLADALGISRQTLNGVLSGDSVSKAQKALSRKQVKSIAPGASIFTIGGAAQDKG